MYALVKTSNKYDVIQKAKIRKNNKRIYSSWQKKLNNADRALLACMVSGLLLLLYTNYKYEHK